MDYIVIDFETGGLDPYRHSALQLGYMLCRDHKILMEEEVLIDEPEIVLTKEAQRVHKLLPDDYFNGFSPDYLVKRITQNLIDHEIKLPVHIMAHNPSFDEGFMKRIFRLAEREGEYDHWFHYRHLDTSSLAGALRLGGYIPDDIGGLTKICEFFHIPRPEKHSALEDCHFCYDVFWKMMDLIMAPNALLQQAQGGYH